MRPLIHTLLAASQCIGMSVLHGEVAFDHDKSGNPTNALVRNLAAPSTTINAINRTLYPSNSLSLSVVYNGAGAGTYQWRLNGTNITGATNATFYKAAVGTTDAGLYSVVVSNASGVVTNQAGTETILATTVDLFGVAYGAGKYVAVGQVGTIVHSGDLITWSTATSGTSNQLEAIVFASNLFVAVGANGTVLTSTNGVNWTSQNSGNSNGLNGIAYGTNTFVAVGNGGTTITSPNGTSWTTRSFDYPTLEGITYGNGLFVAVGTSGTIWTSPNGINWWDRTFPTSATLKAVNYGNGNYVVGGTDGTLLVSASGTNYAAVNSGTSRAIESVLSVNNTIYAIGPEQQNLVSSNGVAWDSVSSGAFEALFAATVGSGIPVAVGANGLVVTIPTYQLDHFEWASIASPQRANQSFGATITARDGAGNLVSNFSGTVNLLGTGYEIVGSNMILSNISHSHSDTFTGTYGYSFTPNKDLTITHFRHYSGSKVSLWRADNGILLASLNVTSSPGTWTTTALPVPITLLAGKSYLLGVYGTNTGRYYRFDGLPTFGDGTINQSFSIGSDALPEAVESTFWFLVDLVYSTQKPQPLSVTPLTATLANGTASFNVTVTSIAENMVLVASNQAGFTGSSAPFHVYGTNDLALTLSATPNPVAVQSNLNYLITVQNSGPGSATAVNVTNTLPAGVSYVLANPSQGTFVLTNGKVCWNVGTLNQGYATVSISVTPTNAGVILTNSAVVTRGETDANITNNTATLATYVPPTLSLGADKTYDEGNVGIANRSFDVTLSEPSIFAVYFKAASIDDTAISGSDYAALNTTHMIPPGSTSTSLNIGIQGDVIIESDESFYLTLSNVTNATLAKSQGKVTIANDDGLTNQIYYFVWQSIPSPQRSNQPFQITVVAADYAGKRASNFTGTSVLRAVNASSSATNTLLTNEVYSQSGNVGLYTLGYDFTPTNDLFVTHVRHYFGTKVSLWNSGGYLLASTSVVSQPGEWTDTALATPVFLQAGQTYRVGVFSGGGTYYWNTTDSKSFPHGAINASFYASGDGFPASPDAARWHMVDLRYALPATISPTSTGNFTSGYWIGNMTIAAAGEKIVLMADDLNGHVGYSQPVSVFPSNDLAVTIANSPATVVVSNDLVYTVRTMNSGPGSATSVYLTNYLPADVTFISATNTQGTTTVTSNMVVCNIGTLTNLGSATLTLTVRPTIAGQPLTNRAVVVRGEADANSVNNEAVSILVPDYSLSIQLQAATDSGSSWSSAGYGLWLVDTNTTHDGVDAARSGPIVHGQTNWLSTKVRGPGTFSFWWKVSCENGGDRLQFHNGESLVASISGEVDWQQRTFSLGPGVFNFSWRYAKDGNISAGADAGWVDQVVLTIPPFSLSSPLFTNGNFYVTLNGTNGQRLITQDSSDLKRWTSILTNILSGSSSNLNLPPPTNVTYRFYRALHTTD